MQTTPASARPAAAQGLTPVNLDLVDAQQLARELSQRPAPARPRLLIDCAQLRSLHTLGVSHVVSQLLTLHRAGAEVWLRNVTPLLRRCLTLLKLTQVFHTA